MGFFDIFQKKERISNKLRVKNNTIDSWSNRSGYTRYSGERDLYDVLGYPQKITYHEYSDRYCRQDLARAIIDLPINYTWGDYPRIYETPDYNTAFELAWDKLVDEFNIFSVFKLLDRKASLGKYAVLYIGFEYKVLDNKNLSPEKLLYITPFSEVDATVDSWDNDKSSQRFGQPETYSISAMIGESTISSVVPWQQVIHVVECPINNSLEGSPRLESVYNRLLDIEQIVGGSSEMFWRGALPGYVANLGDNAFVNDDQINTIKEQLTAFSNNLQRWIYLQGLSVEALAPQVESPKEHVDVQLQLVSSASGIPLRILVGSERGELASSQDERAWLRTIENRRLSFAENNILRPFIDRLINLKLLPAPDTGKYTIEWPSLRILSEKEKADIGRVHTDALSRYVLSPGADLIEPPELFMRRELGMTDSEISAAESMREGISSIGDGKIEDTNE